MFPWGVVRALVVAVVLAAPLPLVVRRARQTNHKLTWAEAVVLSGWLITITIVLIGDVPSRILYWFDTSHATLAERYSFLRWWEGDLGGNPGYQVVADMIANGAQFTAVVVLGAVAYFWGEKHKKDGRFKS